MFRRALKAQENPTDALTGELGLFANPDGTNSSERSATRGLNGRFINFPLLVKGQSREAVQRILRGEHTPDDEEIAFRRFMARIRGGLSAPSFTSLEAAIAAAGKRSDDK